MDKNRAKALQEFVAEAEDILEALAEDLEAAQSQHEAAGKVRPDLVNKIFREMHSLKGLASMFGLQEITTLSHDLESLLDKIRLGKAALSPDLFALLRESRTHLRAMVGEAGEGGVRSEASDLLRRIHAVGAPPEPKPEARGGLLLDEQTLKSLTEYEEHRLKENMTEGNRILAVLVRFDFADFDTRLRALTERLSEAGEVISTLPVMDPSGDGGLRFRLLYGTTRSLAQVQSLVADAGAEVQDLMPPTETAPAPRSAAEGAEAAVESAEAEGEDLRGLAKTVKVDIEKLDGVMGIVGELNLLKAAFQRIAEAVASLPGQRELAADAGKQIRTMEKKLGELQRAIIDIRLVPINQIFNRLNRTARRLARAAGKEVSVQLYGGDTELDKTMMDELVTPLIHTIRNAIDHGIETPGERVSAGKSREGTLAVSAYQKGNSIVIEVTDDGRGLQVEKIWSAAVRLGLVGAGEEMDRERCMELIFRSGFSSADEVTEVSGRGVGLDAVKAAIEQLKGTLSVWSEPNVGTTFQFTLPITLAIIQSLIVRCCDQTFAVPISSVLETLRTTESEIQLVDQREVISLRGVTLPLLRLEERFRLPRTRPRENERIFIVVARRGDKAAGIVVDDMLGEQETVVHPIGKTFGRLPGLAGATEVGENQVILVIDTASLFSTIEAARGFA
ncbi:MAG: chemotaxis protein CheA [Acidobacteriota bacterium]